MSEVKPREEAKSVPPSRLDQARKSLKDQTFKNQCYLMN